MSVSRLATYALRFTQMEAVVRVDLFDLGDLAEPIASADGSTADEAAARLVAGITFNDEGN